MTTQPLFSDSFLRARFATELAAFTDSDDERALIAKLRNWTDRFVENERAAQPAFIETFFHSTWGYVSAGQSSASAGFTARPEYPVERAGQRGGTGFADLALGMFGRTEVSEVPQVLCEFKDIRSGLDARQLRKGNDRTPVQQCADYLKEASRGLRYGAVEPTWGLVTDMNEFRLYHRDTMPAQVQRFVLRPRRETGEVGLLDEGPIAEFQRFLFFRLFRPDMLLTSSGSSELATLLREQGARERALENDFYREYHAYREVVFRALVAHNPGYRGTKGKLVRLAQRFLDRCIFILFCEDMGTALDFPRHLLRDVLCRTSVDPHYDPNDTSTWHQLKRLFRSMRDGTPFGSHRINRFNGGLFAEEADLEALELPNSIFCARNQGSAPDAWVSVPTTLLYFSARYNFGVEGGGSRTLGLYTLGRIFEQSITDLEYLEAHADGRPSLVELSKRKRDGVYYTPEWVTHFIVQHTVGRCLDELRERHGLAAGGGLDQDEVDRYKRAISGAKGTRKANAPASVRAYVAKLDAFEVDLSTIKVLDPSCGSGAFLIQAMNALVSARKWVKEERERVTGNPGLWDLDALYRETLSSNIYGVDINPESVEITRLALWLHTALPDRPLTSLDHNIRCGNSLVDPSFYSTPYAPSGEAERELVNAFDWQAVFPEVFGRASERAGFDCIVGNPPYVKLQNFKVVDAATSEWLVAAKKADGSPRYASTQTGNFDLYLPFIERGIELLHPTGFMGYIAPNVWLVNDYGEGLRCSVHDRQALERWVDFKDFQVFEEATTYTALQFFRGGRTDGVRCMFVPTGTVAGIEWTVPDGVVAYDELDRKGPWTFAPDDERALLRRLRDSCDTLESCSVSIVVGVQTSADAIYHLERVAPHRYRSFARSKSGEEVQIDDGLMRPIVSGAETKRYERPTTNTYLLFPYDDSGSRPRLFAADEMSARFPLGWAYLRSHERELRARESAKMDRDDRWWGYNYPKNIDKQKLPKLLVPRLTIDLGACHDVDGSICQDNVDVNGVLASSDTERWFLLGALNGSVANFAFRRTSKPFRGDFRSANKQFIAPLPIPRADSAARARVAALAEHLQSLHTARRDAALELDRRLDRCALDKRDDEFLWGDVGGLAQWMQRAPSGIGAKEKAMWAKGARKAAFATRYATLDALLRPGARLVVTERQGEVVLSVDGRTAASVFVSPDEQPLVAATWRAVARRTNVTEAFTAKKLGDKLVALRTTTNVALRQQIVDLDARLDALGATIEGAERQMSDVLFQLYDLTAEERILVERQG